MILIENFSAYFKILFSSVLLPLNEAIINTSCFFIAPKEPWPASVGSNVKLEIPIDDSVLEIFSRIFADFPTPQQTTLPLLL